MHALATDPVSRAILGNGLLYPCQAIFSGSTTPELFHPVPRWHARYTHRPFLIIQGQGVIVNHCAGPEEMAMLSGLAQVVQRLSPSAPVRYLTVADLAGIASQVAPGRMDTPLYLSLKSSGTVPSIRNSFIRLSVAARAFIAPFCSIAAFSTRRVPSGCDCSRGYPPKHARTCVWPLRAAALRVPVPHGELPKFQFASA